MYDFVSIDFEIANTKMDSACSLGIACVKDLDIVNKEYFLIKPPSEHFRPEQSEIHHLTYDDIKNSDTFDIIWKKISHYFLGDYYIFSHNAQFDMSVLNECLITYSIDKPEFKYIDSINFSSKICTNCGTSLNDRCLYFNIPLHEHHNALADAIACAEIVISSVNASKYNNFKTYLKRYSSIRQKNFSELHSQKFFRMQAFDKVNANELTVSNSVEIDKSNPFYKKNCVFTGELESLSRKDAMQKILDAGGMVKNNISKKTNFLVVGTQDLSLVGEKGISTKEKKANEYKALGCDIKIINETVFLNMLS